MNQKNKGVLYLIPSPIGNLNDVSKRVIDVLNLVDIIFCEDTRNTQKLLLLLNISKKTISCHEHNEREMTSVLLDRLKDGQNIGYLSDAGYPCISDPGLIISKVAIENNYQVVPLSGPSAFISALVASSLDTNHFLFYGFLDSNESQRKKEIYSLLKYPYTFILYESPHRINKTINNLYDILGDRKLTIARELSKVHEEFIYTTLKEASEENREYIGELVLVVEGNNKKENEIDEDYIFYKYNELIKSGLSNKDAWNALTILLNIKKSIIKDIVYKKGIKD